MRLPEQLGRSLQLLSRSGERFRSGVRNVGIPLQWDFFEYLPVVLQDAATKDVLMVQYMTEDGLGGCEPPFTGPRAREPIPA
jgi:hypothetical protein